MTDMLRKVKFAKAASNEFLESVEWYESRGKGLGLRFTDEIDSTMERIKLNPGGPNPDERGTGQPR